MLSEPIVRFDGFAPCFEPTFGDQLVGRQDLWRAAGRERRLRPANAIVEISALGEGARLVDDAGQNRQRFRFDAPAILLGDGAKAVKKPVGEFEDDGAHEGRG